MIIRLFTKNLCVYFGICPEDASQEKSKIGSDLLLRSTDPKQFLIDCMSKPEKFKMLMECLESRPEVNFALPSASELLSEMDSHVDSKDLQSRENIIRNSFYFFNQHIPDISSFSKNYSDLLKHFIHASNKNTEDVMLDGSVLDESITLGSFYKENRKNTTLVLLNGAGKYKDKDITEVDQRLLCSVAMRLKDSDLDCLSNHDLSELERLYTKLIHSVDDPDMREYISDKHQSICDKKLSYSDAVLSILTSQNAALDQPTFDEKTAELITAGFSSSSVSDCFALLKKGFDSDQASYRRAAQGKFASWSSDDTSNITTALDVVNDYYNENAQLFMLDECKKFQEFQDNLDIPVKTSPRNLQSSFFRWLL